MSVADWFAEQGFAVVHPQEQRRFQMALGGLILAWTDLESALFATLRYYTNVSPKVARSLFHGARAKEMSDFLKNIAHNTSLADTRTNDLDKVLAHINTLNTMRNWLVHHTSASEIITSEDAGTKRVLTNKRRAAKAGNEFAVMIDAEMVENMCSDSVSACWHLLAHRDKDPFAPWKNHQGLSYAWLYKPPQPKNPPSKNKQTAQAQPRQPKSSRAKPLRTAKE